MEALTALCGGCGGDTQVAYCHAWGEYLCDSCRYTRNNEVLRVPLEVKRAMQAEDGEVPF
jgi:hypothetical protein